MTFSTDTSSTQQRAVLFINLGTPQSPRKRDVMRYLRQFLLDKRVLSLPWLHRHLLVQGIILPRRMQECTRRYTSIWMKGGSPFMVYTQRFIASIRPLLEKQGIQTFLGMRYQEPSLPSVLNEIQRHPLDELIVIPLYPHYASATTGSSLEMLMREMQRWPFFPSLRILSSFYTCHFFINAWATKIAQALRSSRSSPFILFSFHGLPQKQVQQTNPRGDCFSQGCCEKCGENRRCYVAQCKITASRIAEKLQLPQDRWGMAFQSRLGKETWTQPYLSEYLQTLLTHNIRRVLVVPLSFVVDCIETCEELDIEYRAEFLNKGGEEFMCLDSLNDNDEWVQGMAQFITKHCLS